MQGDIFATKGIEYLITVVYLLLLVGLAWGFGLRRFAPASAAALKRPRAAGGPAGWFRMADGYGFHQGHAWAVAAESDGVVTVGLDDFAARLLGEPDALELPPVGAAVREGEPGWTVRAGERALPMLAPVAGEVVAVNPAVTLSPRLAADDPYGAGWLMRVKVGDRGGWRRTLLSGELAAFWMQRAAERLRGLGVLEGPRDGELGVVLPDGGEPVRGLARALGPEQWAAVTREFFLIG